VVDAQEFPKNVDVTVVEGAVSSTEDAEKLHLIRQRTKLLVSLGDCAVTSNVPSMRNPIPVRKILERVYVEGVQTNPGVPNQGVPPLLRQAVPLHDVVKVDLHVPGCPPPPKAILYVLTELLEGRMPDVSTKIKFG
jgi:NAD-reducing hydrogenase small subunit